MANIARSMPHVGEAQHLLGRRQGRGGGERTQEFEGCQSSDVIDCVDQCVGFRILFFIFSHFFIFLLSFPFSYCVLNRN